MMGNIWLGLKQAASMCNITHRHFMELAERHEIYPAMKITGVRITAYFYWRKDVERLAKLRKRLTR
jgi:hypothetical protein